MYKMRKQAFVALMAVLAVAAARAQGNLPYADDRPIHFGFFLGLNTMDFGTEPSLLPQDDGRVYLADVPSLMPGFTAGIISDLRLNRYFNLRFSPSINFTERRLAYRVKDDPAAGTYGTNVMSIPLMLPLHVKYSAERLHNFRPYVLAGGGVSFECARDKERDILLKPFDYYVEVGTGCDIYFPFFKFAPELRFAIGFNNVLTPIPQRDPGSYDPRFTRALDRLTTKTLTLCFNFE